MLSQKTRYAIRAMQHLAGRHGQGPVQLAEIAAEQNIPANFSRRWAVPAVRATYANKD